MPLPTMPAKPAQLLDPSEFAPVSAVPKAKSATQSKKPVPALERVALLETGEAKPPAVKARAAGGTRARTANTDHTRTVGRFGDDCQPRVAA